MPARRNFWETVDVGDVFECWPWLLSLNHAGYGQVSRGGRYMRAHRVAWELENGRRVPDGMCVLHACDNPRCCNPHHLRIGTHAENMREMVIRRRGRSRRGTSHANAKLDEAAVRKIKAALGKGTSQRTLSREFRVSPACIWAIKNGRTWRHVEVK